MNRFVFTRLAEKRLQKLESSAQQRIVEKLKTLKKHPDILSALKPLHDFAPATHRLRLGVYRLILEHKGKREFWILDVGHRRDIYR